jgi:DMSO/TMAO reductase YedYZ molybdopterin-dependent catalytic subunit
VDATGISLEELQLAARNHGLPLEALRYPITPPGLHYLLIHYDIPDVDPDGFRLTLDGHVRRHLTLTLPELRRRPVVEVTVTMECAGNGRAQLDPRPISQPWLLDAVGTAQWRGTPLAPLLHEAGLLDGAVEVLFTGIDRGTEGGVEQNYQRSVAVDDLGDAILAYEMNGHALPPQHGFPLRLIVPGWYGMTNVKWLERVTVLDAPFAGYQHERAYRFRTAEEDAGRPVQRMAPRALMIAPGIPDFLTRERRLAPGPCVLEGRAWSGRAPVARVEVSADGGETWGDAELGEAARWAWLAWRFAWNAEPGERVLCCRATDEAGNVQPADVPWNVGGYENNAVQRIAVRVE